MIPMIVNFNSPPPIGRLWVGVDPGFQGAIGIIDSYGKYVACVDMPVVGASGRKQEFNVPLLCSIVRNLSQWKIERVVVEFPATRPGEAPESAKRFGVGLGLLWGIFAANGLPIERVAPNKWKGRLGLIGKAGQAQASKLQAVEMAERFIRDIPVGLLRGPRGGLKDGRAEAFLIAWEALTCSADGLRKQPKDVRLARMLFGSKRRRSRGENAL
ncbi:hypothetical protein LCGC14_1473990 [marine sediment metagenome]|uniref:Uncharacterized protein n=1 Tax=marine sediment metagenome TaxID=412755 RepID=A0A0F9MD79_9ZZZZ